MQKKDINAILTFLVLVIIGLLVAWAGSQGGVVTFGIPLFARRSGWLS